MTHSFLLKIPLYLSDRERRESLWDSPRSAIIIQWVRSGGKGSRTGINHGRTLLLPVHSIDSTHSRLISPISSILYLFYASGEIRAVVGEGDWVAFGHPQVQSAACVAQHVLPLFYHHVNTLEINNADFDR